MYFEKKKDNEDKNWNGKIFFLHVYLFTLSIYNSLDEILLNGFENAFENNQFDIQSSRQSKSLGKEGLTLEILEEKNTISNFDPIFIL